MATQFWIREAGGALHEGVCLQGGGGWLRGVHAERTLWVEIARAEENLRLRIYEPQPGHALGFIPTRDGREQERPINLVGARVERVEVHPWDTQVQTEGWS